MPIAERASDITEWVKDQTGHTGTIDERTSLQDDIRVFGDDFHDLMNAYADEFDVNMDDYRWYFHTGEEGWNLGALFVDPPYRRVSRISVTVGMLQAFAESGRWSIDYPKHEVPDKRVDLRINLIFSIVVVLGIFAILVWRLLR